MYSISGGNDAIISNEEKADMKIANHKNNRI